MFGEVGWWTLGVGVIGYLLGCLPVARVVAGRVGVDPTVRGSGNPGASNVYRTAGRRAGAIVLVGDMAKGAAAAGMGLALGDRLVGFGGALAAVVGHVAPATRRLRGGKGMATALGAMAVLSPWAALAAVAVWSAVVVVTSVASLASLAAVLVMLAVLAVGDGVGAEVVVAAAMAGVVLVRHAGNVGRLVRGSERTLHRDLSSSTGSWAPIPTGALPPRPGADHR